MQRAEISLAAVTGNVEYFQTANIHMLTHWKDVRGRTATHLAAGHSHVEVLLEVLKRTGKEHLDLQDEEGITPLKVAAESGSLAAVVALLSHKADPNRQSHVSLTPLHYASARGQARTVHALLDARSNIDALGAFPGLGTCSPIMVAAWQGHSSVVRTLGSNMADLESRNTGGYCALTAAAARGRTDVVAALLSLRASVDARERTCKRSAIMVAIQSARVTTVGLLLSSKAKITAKEGEHYCMLCEGLDMDAADDIRCLLRNAQTPCPSEAEGSMSQLGSAPGSMSQLGSLPTSQANSPVPRAVVIADISSPESSPQVPSKLTRERGQCGNSWRFSCGYSDAKEDQYKDNHHMGALKQ
jgi:ankyrin repeat protein